MRDLGRTAKRVAIVMAGVAALAAQTLSAGPVRAAMQTVPPSNWPQGGYGAAHYSYNPVERALSRSNAHRLHRVFAGRLAPPGLLAGPVVVGPNLYTALNDMVDWNSTTGAVVWSVPGPNSSYSEATPAADAGHVFGTWSDGSLVSYNGATGSVNWRDALNPKAAGISPPVVSGGLVYLATVETPTASTLWAVDETTGHVSWSRTDQQFSVTAPAVTATVLVAPTRTGLAAYDPATGAARWSVAVSDLISGVALNATTVYVVYSCQIGARQVSTGALIWTRTYPASCGSQLYGPALGGGQIYLGSNSNHVFAVTQATGALVWTATGPGGGAYPSVANGVVYLAFRSLEALNTTTGAVLLNLTLPSYNLPQPAVAQGRVYLGVGYTISAYAP